MTNPIKGGLILAALVVFGLLLLLFGSNNKPTTSNNLPPSVSRNALEGESNALPPNTTEVSAGILETAYGQPGALKSRYLEPSVFERFGAETPSRVKYRADLELDLLQRLLTPDNIPSIDTPKYESALQADRWLNDDDIVLTVVHNGIARAYPTRILNWHEIVNDIFGNTPVTITFCPLCNSGLIFIRPVLNGAATEFGTSGRVYKSDLVMYDRQTLSLWSQIEGRPMAGSLVGQFDRLEQIPAGMTQWGFWKAAYPDSDVLSRPTTDLAMGGYPPMTSADSAVLFNRDYNINPYTAYLTDNHDTFGTPFSDRRLPAKAIVTGIRFGDQIAKAYHKEAVQSERLINDEVGNQPVLVLWDEIQADVRIFSRVYKGQTLEFALVNGELVDLATNSLWDSDGSAIEGPMADEGTELEPIAGITTFWFSWFNFHPQTELFRDP